MDPNSLKKLNKAIATRQAAILLTEISNGEGEGRDRVILEGRKIAGELGEAVNDAFQSGKSKTITVNDTDFFLNVFLPSPRIIVIGAVHISQALAKLAAIADFDLIIIDPRTAFSNNARFENVELIAEWPEDAFKTIKLDAHCALVAVCHDPKIDDYPLMKALQSDCFYVGALGSRKTHAARCMRLAKLGASQSDIEKIHAPIGLDIGASTPQEIAIAILAEVISTLRTRKF